MKKFRRRFQPVGFELRVKRSQTGLGLYAGEPIPKGACVIEYIGRSVVGEEQYTSKSKYLFETSRDTMIDGNIKENTARYINHSCKPNCEIAVRKRRIFVFALRNIQAGEELTYDYDEEYFNAHLKGRCRCRGCMPNIYA